MDAQQSDHSSHVGSEIDSGVRIFKRAVEDINFDACAFNDEGGIFAAAINGINSEVRTKLQQSNSELETTASDEIRMSDQKNIYVHDVDFRQAFEHLIAQKVENLEIEDPILAVLTQRSPQQFVTMCAALLTEVTCGNDIIFHSDLQASNCELSQNIQQHRASLLAFHARVKPSISINSYFLRILKYCPATNEIFLGVLIYLDRLTRGRADNCARSISERPIIFPLSSKSNPDELHINRTLANSWNSFQTDILTSENRIYRNLNESNNFPRKSCPSEHQRQIHPQFTKSSANETTGSHSESREPLIYSDGLEYASKSAQLRTPAPPRFNSNTFAIARSNTQFAIDSFNIHRLLIAAMTVASKFFSDIFYTNSRYAKVGGVPLRELNQLELHFLLMSDFELLISNDEMKYYTILLEQFWIKYCALRGHNPDDFES